MTSLIPPILAWAATALLLVGAAILLIQSVGAYARYVYRELNGSAEKERKLKKDLEKKEATIADFVKAHGELRKQIKELEEERDAAKAWKPEEGAYCSCTFEDNHNPGLLTECGYHEDIRGALGVTYRALKEVQHHATRVLKEDCTYAKEGFQHIEQTALKAADAVADIIKEAQAPMKQPAVDAHCEICHVHSDENKTIRQRFIPANLCLMCARRDLIVKVDSAPRA